MKKGSLSGSLYRLIYCSRSRIAGGVPLADGTAMIDAELRAILTTCRRRNQIDEITGALLFTASGFAQVLEGHREVLERTFDRIGADPRHSDVTVLSFTPTERRYFPDSPMGYCGPEAAGTPDPLAGLWPEEGYTGPRGTTGGDVLRLLEKSAQHDEQWMTA